MHKRRLSESNRTGHSFCTWMLATLAGVALTAGLAVVPAPRAGAAPVALAWPVVAANHDGRLEVFAPGLDGSLWHNPQWIPGNSWQGWTSLERPRTDAVDGVPAAALNEDGRLEIFARSAGVYYHKWQTSPGGSWSSWESLGRPNLEVEGFPPAVGTNQDGRLEIFMSDGLEVWHNWQQAPNSNNWSGWASLGRPATAFPARDIPAVERNADGRLEVFMTVPGTGLVHHRYQLSPGGSWASWTPVGGLGTKQPDGHVQSVAVAANSDGRLEAFGVVENSVPHLGTLWHSWQKSPGQGWSDWKRLGNVGDLSPEADLTAIQNQDGRLEVFGITSSCILESCRILHQWQTSAGGSWSAPSLLSSDTFTFKFNVAINLDGRLELFTSKDGVVYHAWQQAPGQGWSGFVPLEADPDPGGPGRDRPPTVRAGRDAYGPEGSALALNGQADDDTGPPDVTWTYQIDSNVDQGATCTFSDPHSLTTTITCTDDASFVVTLTADDGVNNPVSSSLTAHVRNVAPRFSRNIPEFAGRLRTTDSRVGPAPWSVYRAGSTVQVNGPFIDPGSNDTQTCVVRWDDGETETYASQHNNCDRAHVYQHPGMYTIVVTATDDDGGVDSWTTMVVVYDPDAGFATTGGFIDSPADALTSIPDAQGKLHVQANPKYHKADAGPAPSGGKVDALLQESGFRLASASLEWLVVTVDDKVAVKGIGSINGESGYGFVLYGYDQPDALRLVVWPLSAGPVPGNSTLYDNRRGADFDLDLADPQSLAGGSVQIHR
jgi:PKD domain